MNTHTPGYCIRNARIVNEGQISTGDIYILDDRIFRIVPEGKTPDIPESLTFHIIDGTGKYILPGMIDDQVHFREPGLTHKGDIASESRAAVAGGITSYLEMPNTQPQTVTQELLAAKNGLAEGRSWANYGFFMGTTNDNLDEILATDLTQTPGLKIFMGSSTGNMLVDNRQTLETIFRDFKGLIALHCEDEATIKANSEEARLRFGEDVPVAFHPVIRSEQACYKSSSMAVELAKRFGTRIHVLHISTALETSLFSNSLPLEEKKITAEACIHHLWFSEEDYPRLGNRIKWNPAVKSVLDKDSIWKAVLDDRIDVIATDHAPHTSEEKQNTYFRCPSGGPLVQHALPAMLEFVKQGKVDYAWVVKKMAHNPAILFRIKDRGFIREGYYADLVIVDPDKSWTVAPANILYKCGWSPFEEVRFSHSIHMTFVNGKVAYENGNVQEQAPGTRLHFRN